MEDFTEWFLALLALAIILILALERGAKQIKGTRILPKLPKPKFLRRFKFYKDDKDDEDQNESR